MTTAKRQSIADFAYYSICQGQKEIGPIGYSPLPVNLVEAGFGQIDKLQTGRPGRRPDHRRTSTPATTRPSSLGQPNTNYLATIAPLPPACDKIGAGPCAAGVTPNGIGATPTSSGTYPGASAGAGGSRAAGGSGGGSASAAAGAGGPGGHGYGRRRAAGPLDAAAGLRAGRGAGSAGTSATTLPTYDPATLGGIDLVARLSTLWWAALCCWPPSLCRWSSATGARRRGTGGAS